MFHKLVIRMPSISLLGQINKELIKIIMKIFLLKNNVILKWHLNINESLIPYFLIFKCIYSFLTMLLFYKFHQINCMVGYN